MSNWRVGRFTLDLTKPKVMGIVNVTPDSFSDGGQFRAPRKALEHCEKLLRQGADLLDLGAESSRPGAAPVSLDEELARLVPVVREAVAFGVPISVDTYKSEVMRVVLDLGADIVNDIWALRQPGALDIVAAHPTCGVVLMHMHREPQTMQLAPMQVDNAAQAVATVALFLSQRVASLAARGVDTQRICLDPGIGFGKSVAQNFGLLKHQSDFLALGQPLLAAWSRKSSLGAVTGLSVQDRCQASVLAAMLAVERGARVVRVHDVAETAMALKILDAMNSVA